MNFSRVVYHCVDRWDKFDMYDSAMMTECDRLCCQLADVVIASSGALYERCRERHERVSLIDHGVDVDHFQSGLTEERPADLPDGTIVGFFGLLSEWVDQELLIRLARELRAASGNASGFPPEADRPAADRFQPSSLPSIVLIGKADVAADRLRSEPNIYLLGPRRYADLPAYAAHFNVGIIPFQVNELTSAVNPIKLREMMAAGCPVVSTDLREVSRYASEFVSVASDVDSFISEVQRFLDNPAGREERLRISQTVEHETWEAKVGEILGAVHGAQGEGQNH